jgi:signal transduction histidine kinase
MSGPAASRWERVTALGVALLACLGLLAGSRLLLDLTAGPAAARLGPTAAAIAGLTALVHLVLLVMFSRTGPIGQAAAMAVRGLVVAPPLAAAVVVPALWGQALLATSAGTLVPALGPALAAVWAAALLVAVPTARLLVRVAPREDLDPDAVAGRWRRAFTGLALASGLVALGHALGRGAADPPPPGLGLLVLLGGLVVVLALVGLAGHSVGVAAAGEVLQLARRLEREAEDGAPTRPIVVTRDDRMGVLLGELETLRRDLAAEHQRYQDTLAQTKAAAVAKAEFLAAVSHELRTPLNSICGFSQLLLEGMPTELAAEQREDVRLIRTSGMQLLGLINDILDISMIESGELRLYFAPEDIAEIVDEVARAHRPLVQEVGVELRVEVPQGLPRVVCDRRRIGQILNNLLSNATKFTERGAITISAVYDPLSARLNVLVSDTGIGIPTEHIEAIFLEYHQVGGLSQRKQGTGLGLAIARSIAVHHGGALWVQSSPGRGSTFTLALPLDPPRKPTSIDMTAEAVRASQRLRQPRSLPAPEDP